MYIPKSIPPGSCLLARGSCPVPKDRFDPSKLISVNDNLLLVKNSFVLVITIW